MPVEKPMTREQLRSKRKRVVRARTISVKRMTQQEIELGRILYPQEEIDRNQAMRPKVRSECFAHRALCKFCNGQGVIHVTANRFDGSQVRQTTRDQTERQCGSQERNGSDMGMPVRLRDIDHGLWTESSSQPDKILRMPERSTQRIHKKEKSTNERIQGVGFDDPTVHEPTIKKIPSLRRAGNLGVRSLEGRSDVSEGYGAKTNASSQLGQDQRQRELRANQLQVGHSKRTGSKQEKQSCPDCYGTGLAFARLGEELGDIAIDVERAAKEGVVSREGLDHAGLKMGPCAFCSCQHHLYLDINPRSGAIKLNFPDLEPHEMADSCVLDVVDRGGATLEEVGKIANITRERIRQIENIALNKILDSREAIPLLDFKDPRANATLRSSRRHLPIVDQVPVDEDSDWDELDAAEFDSSNNT